MQKKISGFLRKNSEAPRRFFSTCRFWARNLTKTPSYSAFSINISTEASEFEVISVFFPPPQFNYSLKMSSQGWSPIVGFYGMLCVWTAWLSGSGTVLSTNGTIFEDKCKKTTTCEALKYNTCLGSPLPYTHTSLILAEDSSTQEEAIEKLTMWSGKFCYIPGNMNIISFCRA